ncbi:MAG: radical SAM protein [Theionarchaea archaeon]|nr:radical SAM protein [Theionarchaea archaeon]
MKPSYYNFYIPLEDGTYILHNRLTGALLVVDEETKTAVTTIHDREDELPEELLNTFTQHGIIIQDNEDELLQIKYRFKTVVFNPQLVAFSLAPTARCNLSCRYCVQRVDESLVDKSAHTATMSESTVKSVLSFLKNMTKTCNVKKLPVSFYGGEPLMAKQLVLRIVQDLNQWCKEHSLDFETGVTTNLTLLDKSFLEDIQKYPLFYFRTTLDGPERIHNQFRYHKNGKGTYEEVVANMGMLLDEGIPVRVQININKYYTLMSELFDDLKERGLTSITIELYPLIDPMISALQAQKLYGILDEKFPSSESQFAIPFDKIPEAKTFVLRAAFERGFMLPPSQLGVWTPCDGAQAYHFLVDPFGDVYKCVGGMLMKSFSVGHIHEDGSLERYPFFYKWMDIIDPTTIEKCQTCQLLPSCGGGCIVGRTVGNIPCVCEISHFPGEEYFKIYLREKYPELKQVLTD